jgi:hypothetical protein
VLFGVEGVAFNTLIGVPLQAIAFLILMALSGEPELPKLMRRCQGRYIRPEYLDGPARDLLDRAQTAVDTVFHSHVHREGLLDDVRNTVTLPHQRWDVAQTFAELSRLRGEQARGSLALNTPASHRRASTAAQGPEPGDRVGHRTDRGAGRLRRADTVRR